MANDSWGALFERARPFHAPESAVAAAYREREQHVAVDDGSDAVSVDDPVDPEPARVVADADVLAADLIAGAESRAALDRLRAHSWTTLVASDPLLAAAEALVTSFVDGPRPATDADDPADAPAPDAELVADWRRRVENWRTPVSHPPDDHPALASAYRGGAMHVLTLDESLQSPGAGAAVRDRIETSVRSPAAFARLFDPAALYEHAVGGDYPGEDRDPRA